jgi:hypothetical protein
MLNLGSIEEENEENIRNIKTEIKKYTNNLYNHLSFFL